MQRIRIVARHFRCAATASVSRCCSVASGPGQPFQRPAAVTAALQGHVDPPFARIRDEVVASSAPRPHVAEVDEEQTDAPIAYRCAGCSTVLFYEDDRDVNRSAETGYATFDRTAFQGALKVSDAVDDAVVGQIEAPIGASKGINNGRESKPLTSTPEATRTFRGASLSPALLRKLSLRQALTEAPPQSLKLAEDVVCSPHAMPTRSHKELVAESDYLTRLAFQHGGPRLRKEKEARKFMTRGEMKRWRALAANRVTPTVDRAATSVVRRAWCACCGGFVARETVSGNGKVFAVNASSVLRSRGGVQ
jgi:hypothetical protein